VAVLVNRLVERLLAAVFRVSVFGVSVRVSMNRPVRVLVFVLVLDMLVRMRVL
jgi:hypothetical protein